MRTSVSLSAGPVSGAAWRGAWLSPAPGAWFISVPASQRATWPVTSPPSGLAHAVVQVDARARRCVEESLDWANMVAKTRRSPGRAPKVNSKASPGKAGPAAALPTGVSKTPLAKKSPAVATLVRVRVKVRDSAAGGVGLSSSLQPPAASGIRTAAATSDRTVGVRCAFIVTPLPVDVSEPALLECRVTRPSGIAGGGLCRPYGAAPGAVTMILRIPGGRCPRHTRTGAPYP